MTLGTQLGPYEIVAMVGAGGMGEVYRARDTRLNRTVAIKILPPHLSSDPLHRQRLEREAQAISSLQHLHICTLHDVGRQDETDCLVMEYLDSVMSDVGAPREYTVECRIWVVAGSITSTNELKVLSAAFCRRPAAAWRGAERRHGGAVAATRVQHLDFKHRRSPSQPRLLVRGAGRLAAFAGIRSQAIPH